MVQRENAANMKIWLVRVAGALVVGAILGCAAGLIRNGNRITALETHMPYIRASLENLEKKLEGR